MREKNSFPLLETLARGMGCAYLSDLKYLDASGQRKLAGLVRSVPVQAAEANAWNDTLTYLTGQPAQAGAGQARQALLQALESSLDTRGPAGYNVGE